MSRERQQRGGTPDDSQQRSESNHHHVHTKASFADVKLDPSVLDPGVCFVWNDTVAINQHGDCGEAGQLAMAVDLGSIGKVIGACKRALLQYQPLRAPAVVPVRDVPLLRRGRRGGELGFSEADFVELTQMCSALCAPQV